MAPLTTAASSLPTDLSLFADKIFTIVGFIVIPLLAILLISLCVLMTFFVVGLVLELFGISIPLPLHKKRNGDKQ